MTHWSIFTDAKSLLLLFYLPIFIYFSWLTSYLHGKTGCPKRPFVYTTSVNSVAIPGDVSDTDWINHVVWFWPLRSWRRVLLLSRDLLLIISLIICTRRSVAAIFVTSLPASIISICKWGNYIDARLEWSVYLFNLSSHSRYMYPKMVSPSMYISHEDCEGVVLHYRTTRNGFCPYLIGKHSIIGSRFY